MSSMPLVCLPDGQWVDPADVYRVIPFVRFSEWSVIVTFSAESRQESWRLPRTTTEDEAKRVAGEIARTVNEARATGYLQLV